MNFWLLLECFSSAFERFRVLPSASECFRVPLSASRASQCATLTSTVTTTPPRSRSVLSGRKSSSRSRPSLGSACGAPSTRRPAQRLPRPPPQPAPSVSHSPLLSPPTSHATPCRPSAVGDPVSAPLHLHSYERALSRHEKDRALKQANSRSPASVLMRWLSNRPAAGVRRTVSRAKHAAAAVGHVASEAVLDAGDVMEEEREKLLSSQAMSGIAHHAKHIAAAVTDIPDVRASAAVRLRSAQGRAHGCLLLLILPSAAAAAHPPCRRWEMRPHPASHCIGCPRPPLSPPRGPRPPPRSPRSPRSPPHRGPMSLAIPVET